MNRLYSNMKKELSLYEDFYSPLFGLILSHLFPFDCIVIYVWIFLVVDKIFFSLLFFGLLVLYYSLLVWSV